MKKYAYSNMGLACCGESWVMTREEILQKYTQHFKDWHSAKTEDDVIQLFCEYFNAKEVKE